MKPPKCRLCGHEHWSREPHKFVANTVANESVANNVTVAVANKEPRIGAGYSDRMAVKEASTRTPDNRNRSPGGFRVELWRQANRERYNARMKDYMRKHREQKTA